jgi:hydrogenase expression/formation protein HypE
MGNLVREIRQRLTLSGEWKNMLDDSASCDFDGKLLFTTDSYVVTPLEFPGGNIGKIAICGTINDLAVMGAEPTGISLGMIIEEGLPKKTLFSVIDSINEVSKATGIPVITGDTKVMERGKVDRLVLNTSGVGRASVLLCGKPQPGDVIIVSGSLGDHGATILSERFELKSSLESDCKPLIEEIRQVRNDIRQAKDITRGGLAAILNEFSERNGIAIEIDDESVPFRKEIHTIAGMLGIDPYSLACEGRFACIVPEESCGRVLEKLSGFNNQAAIIGKVSKGSGVTVKTRFGKRLLPIPSGVIVPRIC